MFFAAFQKRKTGYLSLSQNPLTLEAVHDVLMHSDMQTPFLLDLSDFNCTLSKIKVAKLTLGHTSALPKLSFDLGADIKEIETAKGRLRLKYTLFLDANPAFERAELSGEVTITSPAISAVTDLQALGEDKISDIAMGIYAKNYEILYLTFQSAGLVAPSPFLIKDVHMVAGEIVSDSEAADQKAPKAEPVAPTAQ
jgi:hypothetical protein